MHEKEELYEREKSFAVKYALDKQHGQLEKEFSERLKKELAKRRVILARQISHGYRYVKDVK